MRGLDLLYDYAEEGKIFVYFGDVRFAPAVTIKEENGFDIALDYSVIDSERRERDVLMHELSHIATGAFYKDIDDLTCRRKMEQKADRWQIKFLVPKEMLESAYKTGITEIWELAEYFDVTEEFMTKAIMYYKNNNIICKGSLSARDF